MHHEAAGGSVAPLPGGERWWIQHSSRTRTTEHRPRHARYHASRCLGLYGDASAKTPVLNRLAREGVSSIGSIGGAAHVASALSLFTGLYPPHHGVRDNGDEPLDARHGVVAERLRARGLGPAAFVGSAVLAANRGLARGFDVYSDGRRPAARHLTVGRPIK